MHRGGAAAGEADAPPKRTGAEMWRRYANTVGAARPAENEVTNDSATAASSTDGNVAPESTSSTGVRGKYEAMKMWKLLTNKCFTTPANFEPQNSVHFIAGRPVVVIREM